MNTVRQFILPDFLSLIFVSASTSETLSALPRSQRISVSPGAGSGPVCRSRAVVLSPPLPSLSCIPPYSVVRLYSVFKVLTVSGRYCGRGFPGASAAPAPRSARSLAKISSNNSFTLLGAIFTARKKSAYSPIAGQSLPADPAVSIPSPPAPASIPGSQSGTRYPPWPA